MCNEFVELGIGAKHATMQSETMGRMEGEIPKPTELYREK